MSWTNDSLRTDPRPPPPPPPPFIRKSRFILRGGGSVHGLSPVSKSHQLRKICNQNLPRTCRNRFSDNGVADTSKNITPLASYFLLMIFETKDIKINKFQFPPICRYKNRCLQGTNICVKLYPKRPCARWGIFLLGSDQNLSGFGFLVQIRAFAGICKFECERKTQSGRMMLTCRWSIRRSSYKREWNNCVIKNAHKISKILPDFICTTDLYKLHLYNRFSACF